MLELPAAARARGASVRALLRAHSLFVPPRLAGSPQAAERLAELFDGALAEYHGAALHGVLVHDGSPVASAVAEALRARLPGALRERPLGDGCLSPALLLAKPPDRLLITATGYGHIALVLVMQEVPAC
jgi:3-oxoacyl-[acyl-carrier-protein] synthase II